jgi:uncharacterized protein (DUF58 family)
VLLLDTRRSAHAGSGVASSFEFAVSAAASIGVHVGRAGMDGQLITDAGAVTAAGMFEDVLLDSLAVVKTSRGVDLSGGLAAIRASGGGLLIVVAGRLSAVTARQLATSRRDGGPAIALLLAVSTWSAPGGRERDSAAQPVPAPEPDGAGPQPDQAGEQPGGGRRTAAANDRASRAAAHAETSQATAILSAAGWRVITVDAGMPLATAWRRVAGIDIAARPVTVSGMPGAAV